MSVMLCPWYFLCCSINVSDCLVCCVLDIDYELFGETIRNMFWCGYCFVTECDGCVLVFSVGGGAGALLDRQCMVFHRMCVLCL